MLVSFGGEIAIPKTGKGNLNSAGDWFGVLVAIIRWPCLLTTATATTTHIDTNRNRMRNSYMTSSCWFDDLLRLGAQWPRSLQMLTTSTNLTQTVWKFLFLDKTNIFLSNWTKMVTETISRCIRYTYVAHNVVNSIEYYWSFVILRDRWSFWSYASFRKSENFWWSLILSTC